MAEGDEVEVGGFDVGFCEGLLEGLGCGLGVVLGCFAWVDSALGGDVAVGLVGEYGSVVGGNADAEVVCGGFDA